MPHSITTLIPIIPARLLTPAKGIAAPTPGAAGVQGPTTHRYTPIHIQVVTVMNHSER